MGSPPTVKTACKIANESAPLYGDDNEYLPTLK